MLSIVLATLGLLLIAAFFVATRPGADLAAEHAQRLHAAQPPPAVHEAELLSAEDVAALPPPVQRYLQRCGALGRPRLRGFQAEFEAEMFRSPGGSGMAGPVEQFNAVLPPWRRLFFMRTRMFGLPVAVLHDYAGAQASMQVRVAQVYDAVQLSGAELARTETVTLLNDLCFFAPSSLVGPHCTWHALDERRAEVAFTNGPHSVRAQLLFDDDGNLVNFRSDDRAALQPDGTLQRMPWSTPMGGFAVFAGRRVPTTGEAIWHRPEGDFVYGRLKLVGIRFDESAAD